MAIFISETSRSFPNVDDGNEYKKVWERPSNGDYEDHAHHSPPGTSYRITFNDDGPGTTVFGKDIVYYIGDNDPVCYGDGGTELNECDYNRQPIYRWYRGGKDHKYTPRQTLRWPTDFTGEQTGPDTGAVKKKYNAEPRNGSPVWFCARTPKDGKTAALHHWYENSKNDTWLVANNNTYTPAGGGGPGSGYVYIEVIGYVFTSEAYAEEFADSDETPVPLYEYYRSSSSSKKDHFYTINPAGEVNLESGVSGVPDCKDPRGEEYQYVGIVGWVFAKDSGRQGSRLTATDAGLIGPIGYCAPVDYATRDGWYDWEEVDLAGHYSRGGTQPAIWTHENYEYQFDADAGPLRAYDADGQLTTSTLSFRSYRHNGTPSVTNHPDWRWGNPDYCKLENRDALFEWVYGKNGAVKGAVPKYLEFHTAFDSQFFYYVYNTSYPWKGPIFSIQYSLSDRNLCPNRRIGTGNRFDDRCVCDEQYVTKEYFSHFYEIRQDKWQTTNTSISLTDFADGSVEQCFKVVDTESTTILFRYLSGGDGTEDTRFNAGDTLNGWTVGETAYFGNNMRCGYMELIGAGKKFSEGDRFIADNKDGAEIEVIAGYGIPDRAGFFGVYEFPKKISYYQVEIDKTALVNSKTLDEAELRAVVDEDGRIQTVKIENAGFGYTNPQIVIQDPLVLNEYGAMDMTREVSQQFEFDGPKFRSPTNDLENYDGEDWNFNYKRIVKNSKSGLKKDSEKQMQQRQKDYPYAKHSDIKITGSDQDEKETELVRVDFESKQLKTTSSERRRKEKMHAAVIEVAEVDDNGSILEIRIKDRGRGYDPDPNNPPKIWVVQVEEERYKMRGPNTKEAQDAYRNTVAGKTDRKSGPEVGGVKTEATKRSLKEVLEEGGTLHKNMDSSMLSILDDGTVGSFQTMMNGFDATYPTGYIKIGELDEKEEIQLCQGVPKECVKITMPSLVGQSLFSVKDMKHVIGASQDFKEMMVNQYPDIQMAAEEADKELDTTLRDMYGWNSNKECITIPQPKFYNVTRFKDLPCPYTREDGRAFGFIVYKYCGSKSDNGHFKVNLSVRGKTTGPDGEKFMEFLNKLPPPSLTQPREVKINTDKKNCWKCTRNIGSSINSQAVGSNVSGGEIEGRCYWDPSGGNDVVFVPVGLDENTFDWDHINYTEIQQLQVWLGQNLSSYRTRTTTYSTPTSGGSPGSGTEGQEGYVPPTPPDPGQNITNNAYHVGSLERLSGGMPAYECWDTYVYRSSGDGNRDGVLDVYCAYFPQDTEEEGVQIQGRSPGQTFWESRIYDGYSNPLAGYQGGGICWYFSTYLYALLDPNYGFGNANSSNEWALEYVNDLSIAVDTQLMNQLGMMMGPNSGRMNIKNWGTGSTIAFGMTSRQMGNPYFDECSGGIFDERNEVVNPTPPVSLRKVHKASYDPGDKELIKAKLKSEGLEWEEDNIPFYDPDFDYQEELKGKLSNFSTDVNNLFNAEGEEDQDYTFQ